MQQMQMTTGSTTLLMLFLHSIMCLVLESLRRTHSQSVDLKSILEMTISIALLPHQRVQHAREIRNE